MKKYIILLPFIFLITSCDAGKPSWNPVIKTEQISEINGCKILKTFEYCPNGFSHCNTDAYILSRPIFSTICNEVIRTVTAHEECTQNWRIRSCKDIVDETNTALKKLTQ